MPVVTTVALTALLSTIAQKGLDKAFETGIENISEDAYNWFKSLFYKRNSEPKTILKELQTDYKNPKKLSNAVAIINNSLDDNPEFEIFFKEIMDNIPKVENTINNSKNVNIGNVNTNGGDFRLGDNYGS
jgi:t-SNARE complex subunit (syntaxin)